MATKKLNRWDLLTKKQNGELVVWVTAYDFITAQLAEECGIDMLLVGDSLGMCIYGYDGTIPVTMDQCIYHSEAVRRAAPNTFVIGDMPFGSYQLGVHDAIANAVRFHKEAGVDAVKLEGGHSVTDVISGIASSGMLVMGHLGLTPQSANALGGFKAQGLTADTAVTVIEEARMVYEAGAFAILIEAVPPEVTQIIRDELPIPIYSIGAGAPADGQLMIISDLVGHFQAFTPKFVKRYGDVGGEISRSVASYIDEVKNGEFPGEKHCYRMKQGEPEKLTQLLQAKKIEIAA
jgi:3-methyl-2-oxobutanoate hydroxymethyltransferase